MEIFSIFFSMKGSWRYGSDKGCVTHGHKDGRTDIHGGKNNIYLPQGETYNYMSPPVGDIHCSSLRVCTSVRPSVCPYVTLPYLQEAFVEKKLKKKSINNIPTEGEDQKIKIQFCQNC